MEDLLRETANIGLSRLYRSTLNCGARAGIKLSCIGEIGVSQARSESRRSVQLVAASPLMLGVKRLSTDKAFEVEPRRRPEKYKTPNYG